MLRKWHIRFLACVLAAVAGLSCKRSPFISFSTDEMSMIAGEDSCIAFSVTPGDVPVFWSSSNPAAVEVSPEGRITAKAEGTAVISALVDGGSEARCKVNSYELPIACENLILFYTCGHNNGLSGPISNNQKELLQGRLPGLDAYRDIVLFLQHSNDREPALKRLGCNKKGEAVAEDFPLNGMKGWNEESVCLSTDTLANVLNYILDYFSPKHYYLVFSSHATGWLPAGYYDQSDSYHYKETCIRQATIGQELGTDKSTVYEMGLKNFAAKLPCFFDAIFFDACLMGGVEVAYELKDKCRYVGFSPTEILNHGMYYPTMVERLLAGQLKGVAEDYMQYYREHSGTKAGCYSLVDCGRIDELARACQTIFNRHGENMATIDASGLQAYFRGNHPWFYDLRDIAVALGATEEETQELDQALERCVIFADHTDKFLELRIDHSCGLSSYLPAKGNATLNDYYRNLLWNTTTGYVQ